MGVLCVVQTGHTEPQERAVWLGPTAGVGGSHTQEEQGEEERERERGGGGGGGVVVERMGKPVTLSRVGHCLQLHQHNCPGHKLCAVSYRL